VITPHHFNLHNELLKLLAIEGDATLPDQTWLYASAYAPVARGEKGEVEIWRERCQLGGELPTMPLRLTSDLTVPIEFEATYLETCRSHWL
jgi:hypothetical protein